MRFHFAPQAATDFFQLVMFPQGKVKAIRPHFSHLSKFSINPPALLGTCKELRKEAIRVYYGAFKVTANLLPQLLPWLKMLDDDSRAAIGKVKVPFDPWSHVDKTKQQQIRMCLKEFKKAGVELKRARFDLMVKPADVPRSLGGDLTDDE